MTVHNARHAPPKASVMIEALRGLGYSTSTAIADIIDNSIAANADRIDIKFIWNGSYSAISILDNGIGMDATELDIAMRLGEKNPLDQRMKHDLGRFGLGLKTASFSQCRRLTVASRRENLSTNSLRWDLDFLADSKGDGWYLLEGVNQGSEMLVYPLDSYKHGTLVLWENLDRIVTNGFSEQNFLDLIDGVERHLSMVFHRFLSRSANCIAIYINNRLISPWDPFLVANSATWSSPVVRLTTNTGVIEAQCHVLPHKDRISLKEYDSAQGVHGWTAQQGFYIYRNERLLVSGSWLGLGNGRSWTKEESHRLARIRLDIPNTADSDWKIDIRKSMARPPAHLREPLTKLAEDTRERARKVFAHRGHTPNQLMGKSPLIQAWKAEYYKEGMRYRIDLEHPAIKAVLEEAGELEQHIRTMLRVLEETIPVQRIWFVMV